MGEKQFDFATFFNARLKERGLTIQKLSALSGISVQDLQNLAEGDFERLPPGPYLRGYTLRLAKILEFDPDIWWEYFKEIGAVQTSGATDRLPENRFAVSRGARYSWVILLVGILVLYGTVRYAKILGKPDISIREPMGNPVEVTTDTIMLRGIIEGGDQVLINNEPVPVLEEGRFEKRITLDEGLNTLEVKGKKFLGRETTVILQIFYDAPETPIIPPAPESTSTPSGTEAINISSSTE